MTSPELYFPVPTKRRELNSTPAMIKGWGFIFKVSRLPWHGSPDPCPSD